MKKVLVISAWAIALMAVTFAAYREGYKDGKERKFDA